MTDFGLVVHAERKLLPRLLPVTRSFLALEGKVDRRHAPRTGDTHPLRPHQVHHRLIVAERILERVLESLRVLRLVRLDLDEAQRIHALFGDAMGISVSLALQRLRSDHAIDETVFVRLARRDEPALEAKLLGAADADVPRNRHVLDEARE